ncbi:unnamed protein product [Candidula unifasciata]|uniref:L-Fucosyltransferase n=1 Tax=Candidula unifasciata TaxID=100452 RepID=A0A8S3ZDH0_9EUPU|nr:unnamed protein product [Candidula unifasciata]
MRIDGYLQSFCYFAEIIDEVRREFIFRDDIAAAAANLLRDMQINHNASLIVGVHARRGDILQTAWTNWGLRAAEKKYFLKAFSLMKSKFPGRNMTFLVSSDDLKWCRENLLGKNVIVMPPASPAVHLAVLSICDHVIMSGGTYGWWAGWLANGDVIYHTGFIQNGTAFGDMIKRQQYYPPHWIGLGN